MRQANTARGRKHDEGRRGARRRVQAGRPADHHRRRSVDRRLPRRRPLLRDPQPLPAPGWAAVPGADRAVGAVERAGRLPARRRGDAAGLPVARLGVRPRHRPVVPGPGRARRQELRRRRRARRRSWPAASPAPTSPRRSRSTSRRTTLSSMPSTTPRPPADRGHRARRQARRRRHPPGAAAQLHRRAPRRAVPLALRALRRARRQPAADVPARAQPGLPRRLLARGRLPRQRLRPHARAAARRAQGRLRDPHPAARPQLRRRGARVRRGAVPRRQRVGPRGDARPRRAPAQHDQHRARDARAGGRRDRALRRRPALRPGPAADHGRVPAGQPQVLADLRRRRRGGAAARRPHRRPRAAPGHGLALLLPRGARRATPTRWPR